MSGIESGKTGKIFCPDCGAELSAREPHRTSEGQHDVTGDLALQLPTLELPEIGTGHGQ